MADPKDLLNQMAALFQGGKQSSDKSGPVRAAAQEQEAEAQAGDPGKALAPCPTCGHAPSDGADESAPAKKTLGEAIGYPTK